MSDHPACSAVPHPTEPQRAPVKNLEPAGEVLFTSIRKG